MLNCWKWSTTIFWVQLAYFASTYSDNGDFVLAAITAAKATVTHASVFVIFAPAPARAAAFAAAAAAMLTEAIIAIIIGAPDVLVWIAVAVFLVLTIVTTVIAGVVAEKEKEHPFPCFVSILPLGIGTVLGGAVLLSRTLWKRGEPLVP